MGIFDALNISASALSAERQRSEVAATNLANVDTTHRTDGAGPFRRKEVVLTSSSGVRFRGMLSANSLTATNGRNEPGSVRLTRVVEDSTPPVRRYEPGHPDADKDGYVAYPAINPVQEMVDLMGSVRAYQLNASAVNASKQLIQQSIDLLKS
jgi:flagellar basal-body rod protein FlgC